MLNHLIAKQWVGSKKLKKRAGKDNINIIVTFMASRSCGSRPKKERHFKKDVKKYDCCGGCEPALSVKV